MKKLSILILTLTILTLAGCASDVSTNTYKASEAGVSSKVLHGTIIGQRAVTIDANSGGVGTAAGAATGAVAGSAIGGSARGNIVGAIGGAVVGGIAGQAIDKGVNSVSGVEYIIKLKKDKSTIAVTQANDLKLAVGQNVLVIYGATTRVIPDETIATE